MYMYVFKKNKFESSKWIVFGLNKIFKKFILKLLLLRNILLCYIHLRSYCLKKSQIRPKIFHSSPKLHSPYIEIEDLISSESFKKKHFNPYLDMNMCRQPLRMSLSLNTCSCTNKSDSQRTFGFVEHLEESERFTILLSKQGLNLNPST